MVYGPTTDWQRIGSVGRQLYAQKLHARDRKQRISMDLFEAFAIVHETLIK